MQHKNISFLEVREVETQRNEVLFIGNRNISIGNLIHNTAIVRTSGRKS